MLLWEGSEGDQLLCCGQVEREDDEKGRGVKESDGFEASNSPCEFQHV